MHLGADEAAQTAELIPVRMLNELAYCPRLFHLEFVQGEFVDNIYTVEGRFAHRRVDGTKGKIPEPDDERPFEARSVSLSSEKLGLSAKIDLVEGDGDQVMPIDYKRGSPPPTPERSHEPERVQLCAYGLLLREHDYSCDRGVLYFTESKTRVEVPFDEALIQRTLDLLGQARALALDDRIPPPLVGSPKCQGCSLHGICLPDEVNQLKAAAEALEPGGEVRPFVPARDDAKPLYVQEQGGRVGVSGEVLTVKGREGQKLGEARLFEVSQVVLMGNVQISSQAARELMGRGIPICWKSFGGWFAGLSDGLGHGNIDLRRAQFRRAEDPETVLTLSRRFVRNKIANCRTLLRRNSQQDVHIALSEMASLTERSDHASNLGELLGLEGNAARIYFAAFPGMLHPPKGDRPTFDFTTRSRRPPKDPVNAMLSLAYSFLAKDLAVTARLVGLDPFLGFYHQPRFGRPALALDLMEEFRPIVADSVVLSVVNTGVLSDGDFQRSGLGVSLRADGRKRFIRAYERRMDEEVTHPVFGYRISYRRVLEVQVRLFARFLVGELDAYPEFRTR